MIENDYGITDDGGILLHLSLAIPASSHRPTVWMTATQGLHHHSHRNCHRHHRRQRRNHCRCYRKYHYHHQQDHWHDDDNDYH